MRWQDIKTTDDRDFYFWEREQEAALMAKVHETFGHKESAEKWRREEKRNLENRRNLK